MRERERERVLEGKKDRERERQGERERQSLYYYNNCEEKNLLHMTVFELIFNVESPHCLLRKINDASYVINPKKLWS